MKKENIFNKIDTKEKAYWLGFLMADGYITLTRGVVLNLSIKDIDQLKKFLLFTGSNTKISIVKRKSIQVMGGVYSKKIVKDLTKYGCISPKTFNIRLPNFKKESLNLAFILGYYDGDGSEGDPLLTSGSKRFLEEINKKYQIGKVKKTSLNAFSLYLGIDFMRRIIKNYTNSMPRKRWFLEGKKVCNCGNKIMHIKSKVCNECTPQKQKRFDPSIEELSQLLKIMPITKIGEKFKVTDNAIRNRCLKMNIIIPKYPRGYWIKKKVDL